MAVTY